MPLMMPSMWTLIMMMSLFSLIMILNTLFFIPNFKSHSKQSNKNILKLPYKNNWIWKW
uniref:ATP synthase F0 subunit 8 n=1 Tax=Acropyga butteli TaxID=602200 RepID=A0A6G5NI77_9HYME|nr:ATP synthase F0 subunit 8 [Acropyga butteli]